MQALFDYFYDGSGTLFGIDTLAGYISGILLIGVTILLVYVAFGHIKKAGSKL